MTTYYKGFPQSDRNEYLHMINLQELEERVKQVMPEGAYYYIASGAENEWNWRNNTAAFNHYQIVPRALTDMQDPQTDTEFMGMKLKTPVMISPIACHGIAHKDAEVKGLRQQEHYFHRVHMPTRVLKTLLQLHLMHQDFSNSI